MSKLIQVTNGEYIGANKYTIKDAGGGKSTVDFAPDSVIREGTPVGAELLNEIQKNSIPSLEAVRRIDGQDEVYDCQVEGIDTFVFDKINFIVNFDLTNTKTTPFLRIGLLKYPIKFLEKTLNLGDLDSGNRVLLVLDKAKQIANIVSFLSDNKNKANVVATIEELKSSTRYKVGDIVEVLGYYAKGDGANHKRKISETDDGSGVQLANGLWANVVSNSYGVTKRHNRYVGKTITVIGDSVVSPQLAQGFWDKLQKIIGAKEIDLRSVGGSAFGQQEGRPWIGRQVLQQELKTTDYYIVSGGINDFGYVNPSPVGNVNTREDLSTTAGGVRYVIEQIYTKNRYAKIIFVIPYKIFVKQNENFDDYKNVIKDICNFYSIPCLDLNATMAINEWNKHLLQTDDVHLTDEGYERLLDIYTGFLYSLNLYNDRKTKKWSKPLIIDSNGNQSYYLCSIKGGNNGESCKLTIDNINNYTGQTEIWLQKIGGVWQIKKYKVQNLKTNIFIAFKRDSNNDIHFYINDANFSGTLSNMVFRVKAENYLEFTDSFNSYYLVFLKNMEDVSGLTVLKHMVGTMPRAVLNSGTIADSQEYGAIHYNTVELKPYFYDATNSKFRDSNGIEFGTKLHGTLAERPAPNSVPYGTMYITTEPPFRYYFAGGSLWNWAGTIQQENLYSIQSLDTPYMTTKMQQEGVYEDFISYMDSKLEYDNQQRELEAQSQQAFAESGMENYEEWLATQQMALSMELEPVPSERLMEFKTKYLG